ncbi:MAG: hypothetical protein BWY78_01314 [Alphaproteobacteria bacterium ADurb.Bin438]|nr:MAG: hypothetical protein BWY78_01314 [Alphaproteobacteria bacterium ADurb.Bin438]
MSTIKFSLFSKTKELDTKINEFLNNVSEAGILYGKNVALYLEEGYSEDFENRIVEVKNYERRNDKLRREIELSLYQNTLIPEARSDVKILLEEVDELLNMFERNLFNFSVEKPEVEQDLKSMFRELVENSVHTTEALVRAIRAFFANITEVNDHIHKVMFYENQGDQVYDRLIRALFSKNYMPLSQKMHLKTFFGNTEGISNHAEDIADMLTLFTIKRMI